MYHISASNRIWAFKFFVGVGGVGGDSHACVHACMHMCVCTHTCMTDMRGCKQEGNKRNFKSLSILYKLRLKSSNMASNTQNAGWSMYI